ncbi:DUF805 domain-containing protein [Motiliproteus sediminis]|uniref:DUF805 domain-containing protein n=1 Tax=Motiliproteus sediminis TaxID=1468178 RepID=UPI001AEFE72C|nr:DUF805 domain-containing protein [Motiliproteus sediminis]
MLTLYFGEIKTGRLTRLRYLGYSLLLLIIILLLTLLLGLVLGAVEQLVGGDIVTTQQRLADLFGLPALLVITLTGAAATFAGLNLMAKRARDIGLPGWISVAILYALELMLSFAASANAGLAVHGLALLALLVAPSNLVLRRRYAGYGDRHF